MPNISVGQQIKAARKAKGVSAQALGQMLDPTVTPTAVYKWEQDRTEPNISHLRQMGDLLGLDIADIFGLNEEAPHDEMCRYFDQMNETQRTAVLGVARAMVDC